MQSFLLLKLPETLNQRLPEMGNLSPMNLFCLTAILFLMIFIVNQIRDIVKQLSTPRGRNRAYRNILHLFRPLLNLISCLRWYL